MQRVVYMKRQHSAWHGWVVIDKPEAITSMSMTTQVRRIFGVRKAGHGGTLDPFASGVLPVALGEATKTMPFVMKGHKEYEFIVRWGEATHTHDADGEITGRSDHRPSIADIHASLPNFIGTISQIPPIFSAIKVGGVRSYKRARAGESFDLPARAVNIYNLVLKRIIDADHACFHVTCGAGTYIRSLGRDLAQRLGTVGHVRALRRVAVGRFQEKDAISLDSLQKMSHDPSGLLYPLEAVLDDILALPLDAQEAWCLQQGQRLRRPELGDVPIVLCTLQRKAIALGRCSGGQVSPFCVFNRSMKEGLVQDVDD